MGFVSDMLLIVSSPYILLHIIRKLNELTSEFRSEMFAQNYKFINVGIKVKYQTQFV